MIIGYDPMNGVPVADGKAMGVARRYAHHMRFKPVTFSTMNVIDAFRVLVRLGDIDYHRFAIDFGGTFIALDKDGRYVNAPRNFGIAHELILEQLL